MSPGPVRFLLEVPWWVWPKHQVRAIVLNVKCVMRAVENRTKDDRHFPAVSQGIASTLLKEKVIERFRGSRHFMDLVLIN